jgi:hypothetical protein
MYGDRPRFPTNVAFGQFAAILKRQLHTRSCHFKTFSKRQKTAI